MRPTDKRPLMISNVWIQAAGLVLMIGFFIMGVLAYYTYNDEPPIPNVVKNSSGALLFTGADVSAVQLKNAVNFRICSWSRIALGLSPNLVVGSPKKPE